jgi:internalin A
LQHIESFGGDSPVFVVLNKIDDNPGFDVNRRFLVNKYPAIVDFFKISCASGAGISELQKSIESQFDKVPILQTRWPRNWFKVKQQLESLNSPFVSVAEYTALCQEGNIDDTTSQEILVDFLHDLGIILHFRDLRLLDTHVLDPRWVTEGVYRIINAELLADQNGVLRLDQLKQVLKPAKGAQFSYSPQKYGYLIELMLKFELCYMVSDNAILVPDLLDIQEPELVFDFDNALRFTFEYKYLPKSIMPRLMVRMHRDIKNTMRWRTGVVLEDKELQTKAIVRVDEKAKHIHVFVTGAQKRDYFSAIRKVIADINASFEKLDVTELVPVPDATNILLDYKELIGYESNGREEIFIGRLGKAYNVQTLLNGIEEKSIRKAQSQGNQTIINVEGDYFEQPTAGHIGRTNQANVKQIHIERGVQQMKYHPQMWERIIVYATAALFVGIVSFLLIRNQPIADPNLVVFVRILLSLTVAVFGATVPGMLGVNLTTKRGLVIRSSGALALFVLTYIMTPSVLAHH